jgi:hypothetical protein
MVTHLKPPLPLACNPEVAMGDRLPATFIHALSLKDDITGDRGLNLADQKAPWIRLPFAESSDPFRLGRVFIGIEPSHEALPMGIGFSFKKVHLHICAWNRFTGKIENSHMELKGIL